MGDDIECEDLCEKIRWGSMLCGIIIEDVTVDDRTTVSAGAVVLDDVEPDKTAVGVPVKLIWRVASSACADDLERLSVPGPHITTEVRCILPHAFRRSVVRIWSEISRITSQRLDIGPYCLVDRDEHPGVEPRGAGCPLGGGPHEVAVDVRDTRMRPSGDQRRVVNLPMVLIQAASGVGVNNIWFHRCDYILDDSV